jgi:hypothetical protein
VEDLVEHILSSIEEEYDLAANQLPWDGAEGGYQGTHWTTEELLQEEIGLELPNDSDSKLLDRLLALLPDETWCDKDPFSLTGAQEVRFDWEYFCNLVKHKKRYFFLEQEPRRFEWMTDRDEPIPAARLLEKILTYAIECELFREYPPGSTFYRSRRQHRGHAIVSPEEIGPPPVEKATKHDRMSPAGIVMFYASKRPQTAISEVYSGKGTYVVGRFKTLRTTVLLDLSQIADQPGFFHQIPDSAETDPRDALRFLNALSRDMSQPIYKDGQESIEYVPTQVVTEFIRHRILPDSRKVDGIVYKSSVASEGYSVVLFATQENIQGTTLSKSHLPQFRDVWMKLTSVRTQKC